MTGRDAFLRVYKKGYLKLMEYFEGSGNFNCALKGERPAGSLLAGKLMLLVTLSYFLHRKGFEHTRDVFSCKSKLTGYFKLLARTLPSSGEALFGSLNCDEWSGMLAGMPVELFADREHSGIFDVFDRFEFRMGENGACGANYITPSVFGDIREKLLDTKAKKRKGVFYTPPEIVCFMCRESLINYVSNTTRIDKAVVRRLVYSGRLQGTGSVPPAGDSTYEALLPGIGMPTLLEIDRALAGVRVLDPACGSGAFLLGMLDEIMRIRGMLTGFLSMDGNPAEREAFINARLPWLLGRDTVSNCLYAADTDNDAAGIAVLRLWLSIVRDMDRDSLYGMTPPEFNLVIGDSLLDEFDTHPSFAGVLEGKGGFDMIIGNPPYVSAVENARNDPETRRSYREKFPLLSGAFDIYTAFLLEGAVKTNGSGVYAWIVPNKLTVSKYAGGVLDYLKRNGLYSIISVSGLGVFGKVGVYPVIVLGDKKAGGFCEYETGSLEDLTSGRFKTRQKVREYRTFKDLGIKLACGTAGFQASHIAGCLDEEPSEGAIPFIVSGSIDKYLIEYGNVRYMGNTYKRAFVSKGKDISDSRWRLWCGEKIIIAGMTREIEALYHTGPLALGVGVYAVYDFGRYHPKFLLALLNSSFLSFYLNTRFKDKHLAGGYLAINKSTLEELPLVDAGMEMQQPFIELAGRIMELAAEPDFCSNTQLQSKAAGYRKEVDLLVYRLYGLTPEEIRKLESETCFGRSRRRTSAASEKADEYPG